MVTIRNLAAVTTAVFFLNFMVLAAPPSSAADFAQSHTPRPQFVLSEPVVELAPNANPNDPAVQQEVDKLTDDLTERLIEEANTPVETPNNDYRASVTSAGFSLRYNTSDGGTTPSQGVQTVLQRALNTWATALDTSSGPIVVDVTWKNFGSTNVIGSAGPAGLYNGPDGLIPAALWNTINNSDVNGATPEVFVELNSRGNWHAGSGKPARGQLDLHSVMLHELAHGLGFLGLGTPRNPTKATTSYDRHVTYGDAPYQQSRNPFEALVSNRLNVGLSDTDQYRVYAPQTWRHGSSLSHFDEESYPPENAGALMTPSIFSGDIHRELDGPVLGVMSQIGWPLDAPLVTPSIVSVNATADPTVLDWDSNYESYGYVPDKFRTEVFAGRTRIASKDVPASITKTTFRGLPSGNLTFRVTPIDYISAKKEVRGTSSSVNARTSGAPKAVDFVDVDGTGARKTVTWPSSGPDTDSYLVQKSKNGSSWTSIATTGRTAVSHTFSPGTYQVRVIARNSFGQSSPNRSIPVPIGSDFVRPVPLDHRIQRLYEASFSRYPDRSGLTSWRLQHAKGKSLTSIADGFTNSAEFLETYGALDNAEFVELLYKNVFGRRLDAVGRETWVSLLNRGGSRGQVLVGLGNSAEFVKRTNTVAAGSSAEGNIYRLYVSYFNRFPDSKGFESWVQQRSRGASLTSISAQFARSSEFQQTYGSLSNTEFVELLYQNVLARNADSGGRSEWVRQLDSGTSRGVVMLGFSESAELILATGSTP